MKVSTIILAFVLFASGRSIGQEKGYCDNVKSKIDSLINRSNFNGVVLVTKNNATIYSRNVGYSDFENKTPLKLDDQFVIGSISKQITAVLVLREYEKGNLKPVDTIYTYLPEIQQSWAKQINIHQLLTHTHGIVDINKPLEFEPGSQFHYSQLGYELLAQILEKITGKTFKDLSTELFNKFGLTNTFHPDNKDYQHLVKGYEENENKNLEFAANSLYNYAAAGSFISNVEDLNKWNQLLHTGKLVRKETLKLMKTRYATRIHPVFDTVEYGYGLLFKNGEETIQIGALGYAPGFVSACYFYPKTNMNLVIVENTARDLDDLKMTFKLHIEIMEFIKL